jgi:formamidopyrimidine-DNA glycosylase
VPELPDVVIYAESLAALTVGRRLDTVTLRSPFVLRSVDPPLDSLQGSRVVGIRRLGKRIVIELEAPMRGEQPVFLVIHLMIAGRLRWREKGQKMGMGPQLVLALFEFENGLLLFTEAGSHKRASLQVVEGEAALAAINRGGLEPLEATLGAFREALGREDHTLKRALTDPRLFSGIGNAYSDEILHAARLSPLKRSQTLTDAETERLFEAVRSTLALWIDRLRQEAAPGFPEKVTAFRPEMAVHGRFKLPCPVCGSPVQRIVYADNECNYCARCQTGGRRLADRSLSRLLGDDWPRNLDELQN